MWYPHGLPVTSGRVIDGVTASILAVIYRLGEKNCARNQPFRWNLPICDEIRKRARRAREEAQLLSSDYHFMLGRGIRCGRESASARRRSSRNDDGKQAPPLISARLGEKAVGLDECRASRPSRGQALRDLASRGTSEPAPAKAGNEGVFVNAINDMPSCRELVKELGLKMQSANFLLLSRRRPGSILAIAYRSSTSVSPARSIPAFRRGGVGIDGGRIHSHALRERRGAAGARLEARTAPDAARRANNRLMYPRYLDERRVPLLAVVVNSPRSNLLPQALLPGPFLKICGLFLPYAGRPQSGDGLLWPPPERVQPIAAPARRGPVREPKRCLVGFGWEIAVVPSRS